MYPQRQQQDGSEGGNYQMAEFLYVLKLLCFCIYQKRTTAKRQATSGSDLLNHWWAIQIDETGE